MVFPRCFWGNCQESGSHARWKNRFHLFQNAAVKVLQSILGFVRKSLHSARLIELADARSRPFSKWKGAKLVAVQSVHRTRDPACFHRSSMKIVPHFGHRCDAVRSLGRISLEIEQLFPAAIRHEDVFPFIGYDHDLEILGARRFSHAGKMGTRGADWPRSIPRTSIPSRNSQVPAAPVGIPNKSARLTNSFRLAFIGSCAGQLTKNGIQQEPAKKFCFCQPW